jgi:hypothetical protein
MPVSKLKREVKEELARIYGSFCYYCDKELPIQNLTLDHIYPKSKRLARKSKFVVSKSVCILSCKECNLRKADREISIENFRKEVMGENYYEIIENKKQNPPLSPVIRHKPNYARNIVYPENILVKKASFWFKFKDLFIKLLKYIT